MVSSKYNRFHFGLTLLLSVMALFGSYLLLKDPHENESKNYFPGLLGLIVGMDVPFLYFRRCPIVKMTDELITVKTFFRTKKYDWDSIKQVYLSNRESFVVFFILGQSIEATSISFQNGEKLIMWEDMYRNVNQMREYLFNKAKEKIKDPLSKIDISKLNLIERTKYAGNPLTTYNTLLVAGIAVIFYILLGKDILRTSLVFFPIGLMLVFAIGFGFQLNYFIIDNNNLIIRNHFFPWTDKQYSLDEILEVDTETPYRKSKSLRILTKDFKSHLYGAGSLRERHWMQLIKDLEFIGIGFRD